MDKQGRPETVEELYPCPWLKAADLACRPVTVTIAATELRDFRQPDGKPKTAVVVAFEKAGKRLICNKTQCRAMMNLAGSPRFADWPGLRVRLAPATAPNGKPTIAVLEAANGKE